jgi:hypothetical protein
MAASPHFGFRFKSLAKGRRTVPQAEAAAQAAASYQQSQVRPTAIP